MKKAIVSVINDLVTDQRVDKVCQVLVDLGFDVVLVGRLLKNSLPLPEKPYKMVRMKLLFTKGPAFYAEYNIRLFFFLLGHKFSLLVANDLDTLLANYIVNRLKRKDLVYDSHELFTETPEVIHRPFVKMIWTKIEKWIFPELKDVFTVSPGIAKIFEEKYRVKVKVVRNIPPSRKIDKTKTRKDLNLPENKKILILQGAGINIQRGAEELVEAMVYLDGFILLIIGSGDVIDILKEITKQLELEDKVMFYPRMPIEELYQYTRNADLGVTIDKDTNLNYRYSLPNKLFDYIHAGLPVLASPLAEVSAIVKTYNIGSVIENHDPVHIANKIKWMFSDPQQQAEWKENLKFAAEELNWEKEKFKLQEVYKKYVG
ncbi:MAG: glycosyltransferase [Bacteroidales bacterium]|nr:glycosyltransferase [Bacteroidales bacterium]MCF8404397.1 glycosyltransferase [Bacteroidales bacterium]